MFWLFIFGVLLFTMILVNDDPYANRRARTTL